MNLAVIIPAYKATKTIQGVLKAIPPGVSAVYVVDDACPDGTGRLVQSTSDDKRVRVLFNKQNLGVGGATKAGYVAAHRDGADVLVKLDSDGQMDPAIINDIAEPVISGAADYSKGNRFWNLSDLNGMPWIRIVGNIGVSFLSKISTGYWHVFDPANGYTALSAKAFSTLSLEKIDDRYFFESDMLFRLALNHAIVADVPMSAVYGDEVSHLKIGHTLVTFLPLYIRNTSKRLVVEYIIRDFSVASLSLIVSATTLPIGLIHGIWGLIRGAMTNEPSTPNSVILTALLLIVGYSSLMNFLAFDYQRVGGIRKILERKK